MSTYTELSMLAVFVNFKNHRYDISITNSSHCYYRPPDAFWNRFYFTFFFVQIHIVNKRSESDSKNNLKQN